MKKQIIYTNKDNEDFTITAEFPTDIKSNVVLRIIGGNNCLYFLEKEEVSEFCEILMNEAEIAFSEC